MSLLQRQRFRNHANLPAAAWIQSLPKPPLAASVSPQPLFTRPCWPTRFRLRHGRQILFSWTNHEVHIITFGAVFGWFPSAEFVALHQERKTINHNSEVIAQHQKQKS